jgi:SAM-dependent methyltransferase
MHQPIKDFTELISKQLEIKEPIYEFGAFQVSGQEGFADLRPYFPNKKYVGADMRLGTGVDVVLDLHNIALQDESVGTVLCFDTLEHVEDPRKAINEIYRILKPGGILAISSVMYCPIHDYPSDYWRFTPEAFKSIMKPFKTTFVGALGKKEFPHVVVGIGIKGDWEIANNFLNAYKDWETKETAIILPQESPIEKEEKRSFHILKMFIPPIMVKLLKLILR